MSKQDQTTAGPIPTAEQEATWGDDYLWMWCAGRPKEAADEIRRLRQALTWCVVNDGEALFDHPNLLQRFRQILALEDQPDEE